MKFPVFDLHCDTALALLGEDLNQAGSLRANAGQVDLDRAGTLGGYAQCFACFTSPLMEAENHISPTVMFEREIATLPREVEHNKNMIRLAHSMDEV